MKDIFWILGWLVIIIIFFYEDIFDVIEYTKKRINKIKNGDN